MPSSVTRPASTTRSGTTRMPAPASSSADRQAVESVTTATTALISATILLGQTRDSARPAVQGRRGLAGYRLGAAPDAKRLEPVGPGEGTFVVGIPRHDVGIPAADHGAPVGC